MTPGATTNLSLTHRYVGRYETLRFAASVVTPSDQFTERFGNATLYVGKMEEH